MFSTNKRMRHVGMRKKISNFKTITSKGICRHLLWPKIQLCDKVIFVCVDSFLLQTHSHTFATHTRTKLLILCVECQKEFSLEFDLVAVVVVVIFVCAFFLCFFLAMRMLLYFGAVNVSAGLLLYRLFTVALRVI